MRATGTKSLVVCRTPRMQGTWGYVFLHIHDPTSYPLGHDGNRAHIYAVGPRGDSETYASKETGARLFLEDLSRVTESIIKTVFFWNEHHPQDGLTLVRMCLLSGGRSRRVAKIRCARAIIHGLLSSWDRFSPVQVKVQLSYDEDAFQQAVSQPLRVPVLGKRKAASAKEQPESAAEPTSPQGEEPDLDEEEDEHSSESEISESDLPILTPEEEEGSLGLFATRVPGNEVDYTTFCRRALALRSLRRDMREQVARRATSSPQQGCAANS